MILLGTLLDLNLGTKNLGDIAEPDTSPPLEMPVDSHLGDVG